MAKTTTAVRTFGSANIRGNPPMKSAAVQNDVRKISRHVDILATQEFMLRYYWTIIRAVLGPKWRSYPSFIVGIAKPVFGGQGIFWKARLFARRGARVVDAFDFSLDSSGIMDNRWIRAVLLEDKVRTSLRCWYVTMHAVVGGDEASDSERRKRFMQQNLLRLERLLDELIRTGEPIVFGADMNIHKGSWAYAHFVAMVNRLGGRIVGTHGVEFIVVFDGVHTNVKIDKVWSIEPKKAGLKTDHEVRCLDHHLESKK